MTKPTPTAVAKERSRHHRCAFAMGPRLTRVGPSTKRKGDQPEGTPTFAGFTTMTRIFGMILLGLLGSVQAIAGPSMGALHPSVSISSEYDLALPDAWVTVQSPMATVHSTEADRPTALRLSRHIAESLPKLAARLDVAVGNRINVVVAPTQALFHSLQPGRSPDWADGTAWPTRGLIFLRVPKLRGHTTTRLETVLDHEIVHVLLGRSFQGRPVPRWLQEGTAQLMAGEYSAETTATLAAGVFGDNLINLQALSRGFPKSALRANLAYAQSADLVAYIRNTYGEKSLQRLIHEMSGGVDFAPAMRIATGDVVDDIDKAWRARLTDSPFSLAPLMSEGIWWGLGAFLVPLAWLSVRRRNKVKVDRWKREEVIEEALYHAIAENFGLDDGGGSDPDLCGQNDSEPSSTSTP